jgi:fermentation-respiration switch protein FrsA (DUF1100 family)
VIYLEWILIVLGTFFLVFICVLLIFFNMAFVRRKSGNLDDLSSPANEFLHPYIDLLQPGMDFINNFDVKEHYILSDDSLRLYGRYFDNNSDKTILLFHGYRSSSAHDFCGALKFYYENGFNILLADQRSHGKSQGKLITFGVKESYDVVDWCEFINSKYAPKNIVLSGVSMGASTVLFALKHKLPQNVKCVIADCGFTSPADIIRKVAIERFKIDARFYLPFLNAFTKIFGKFSVYEDTKEVLKNNKLPVMFIHGEKDTFVPVEMTRMALQSAGKNGKAIFVENADHGVSFLVEPQRVSTEILSFLSNTLG